MSPAAGCSTSRRQCITGLTCGATGGGSGRRRCSSHTGFRSLARHPVPPASRFGRLGRRGREPGRAGARTRPGHAALHSARSAAGIRQKRQQVGAEHSAAQRAPRDRVEAAAAAASRASLTHASYLGLQHAEGCWSRLGAAARPVQSQLSQLQVRQVASRSLVKPGQRRPSSGRAGGGVLARSMAEHLHTPCPAQLADPSGGERSGRPCFNTRKFAEQQGLGAAWYTCRRQA